MAARLKERYQKEIAPAIAKEFDIKNPMAIPRLEKIVINMGLGEAIANAKILDTARRRAARRHGPEAGHHEGQEVHRRRSSCARGCPSARWSRCAATGCTSSSTGWSRSRCRACATSAASRPKAFDGRGNYTLGIRDQLIFPEIDFNKVDKTRGMNISIVTTARDDEQARALLKALGMPFRNSRGSGVVSENRD